MYSIRPYTEDDKTSVLDLVYLSWSTSRYNDLTFDRDGSADLLDLSLRSDMMQVFVLVHDSTVVGTIGVLVFKSPWHKELFASEQVFTIHPDHRGYKQAMLLLRSYKSWAVERGAVVLNVLVDHGDNEERIAKLYKRAGFIQNGFSLAMRI